MDGKLFALWGISKISDGKLVLDTVLPFALDAAPVNLVVAPADIRTVIYGVSEDPVLRYVQWNYIKDNWEAILAKVDNFFLAKRILSLAVSGFRRGNN